MRVPPRGSARWAEFLPKMIESGKKRGLRAQRYRRRSMRIMRKSSGTIPHKVTRCLGGDRRAGEHKTYPSTIPSPYPYLGERRAREAPARGCDGSYEMRCFPRVRMGRVVIRRYSQLPVTRLFRDESKYENGFPFSLRSTRSTCTRFPGVTTKPWI